MVFIKLKVWRQFLLFFFRDYDRAETRKIRPVWRWHGVDRLSATYERSVTVTMMKKILTKHLWGIGRTSLDEASTCWASGLLIFFTSSRDLENKKEVTPIITVST